MGFSVLFFTEFKRFFSCGICANHCICYRYPRVFVLLTTHLFTHFFL